MNASKVVSSAIWAAYGDALGFITEFRDANGARRKSADAPVTDPVAWKRRIGGKFGPTVELPAGCYSDDTQLRLATSRSIRGDGTFDVEAFAKIELPVWRAYHLGAGKGTKAAAQNLERKEVTWYTNFFAGEGTDYVNSGGNGAAMRIQPHVWSHRQLRGGPSSLALDVFRNAITTHGHPRGFLGALFHARCLYAVLQDARVPGPDDWSMYTATFEEVTQLIVADEQLMRVWRPTWEQATSSSLAAAIREVQLEQQKDIDTIRKLLSSLVVERKADAYKKAVREIGGMARATLGSGTKTALLAALLSYLYRDVGVEEAMVVAANELGSDTDTIGTMAGAILGALSTKAPELLPLDTQYISTEAERLAAISQGLPAPSFAYPDLLYWRAPKTQLDVVGVFEDKMAVAGLGVVASSGEIAKAPKQANVGYEWLRLSFGQTVLAKRRAKLTLLPAHSMPQQPIEPTPRRVAEHRPSMSESLRVPDETQASLFEGPTRSSELTSVRRTLDGVTNEILRSSFHPVAIGKLFLELVDNSRTPIEDAIAFASIVAKARVSKLRARRREEENNRAK